MKTAVGLRDLSFRLIQVLVWFEILWAVVFLVGMVFQWTWLTDQLATAFFASGGCALLVLAALTLLNITANLNILSLAAQAEKGHLDPSPAARRGVFRRTQLTAGGLIGLVVLSLWFAEWRLHRAKVADIEAKIESIADSKLMNEGIELVAANGKAKDLARIRDAVSASIQSGARLSFIVPRTVKGVRLYYEFTAWWAASKDDDDPKIEDANLTRFIPSSTERELWDQLVAGKTSLFTVRAERELRAFRRIRGEKGELILLLDTGRRSEYASSSL